MTYKVALHPSVRRNLKKLYRLDRPGYNYVKDRLRLLAYMPEMGVPLKTGFEGKWRIHIGPFVLVYTFDKATNVITLLVFEHYTEAYDIYTAYA
ncbi:type II toxin-antitoxin system RelE/ParE family toxin [Methanosarcina sp. MSH10X1]|uniref:type II toxin-antitoxin system RelE family toxin n=1 Tax=Methanosarcina sp. MSH10X1 TaxID=2507075 RepID=UPI000FFC9B94|nr:type II toxin-antitoxin system RelE/ParE family toxin [Methanosarcina sp. MSH10X1]RXA19951.1 type II toxin-antitoxin system RelE/ParE family toxin [Methanosarcina sp. MSH10X1]